MSGVGAQSFYTPSPENAKNVANVFLSASNITSTDKELIYQQLVQKSMNQILEAATSVKYKYYQDILSSINPVVETQFSQTRVLDDDPDKILKCGRGKDIPLLIGFTNNEDQVNKPALIEFNMLSQVQEDPSLVLPLDLVFKVGAATAKNLGERVKELYFEGKPSVEKLINIFSNGYFKYPAINLARTRSIIGGAPVYLYQFSYHPEFSTIEYIKNITYEGAAHIDDLTFIFKSNSMNSKEGFSPRSHRDSQMIKQMTCYFKNFMTCR